MNSFTCVSGASGNGSHTNLPIILCNWHPTTSKIEKSSRAQQQTVATTTTLVMVQVTTTILQELRRNPLVMHRHCLSDDPARLKDALGSLHPCHIGEWWSAAQVTSMS